MMQIFIRSVNNKTLTLEVPSDVSGNELKERVSDIEFLPADMFALTCGTKAIAGDFPTELVMGDTVVLSAAIKGGMRAKWRKKRMRRLRRKRRKMRMRAK